MSYKIRIYKIIVILIVILHSCNGRNRLNKGFNTNPYSDAYYFISNIKNGDSMNNTLDNLIVNDFKNSVFYVYDSLVYMSMLNDSCDGINKHEPIYSPLIKRISSGQYDIYNIDQAKNVNWILYFSKVHNDCFVVDVIKISPLKFVWPDTFSIKQKEYIYKKEAIEVYKYDYIVNSIFLSIRYIFNFKVDKKGEIIDVKYEYIQY